MYRADNLPSELLAPPLKNVNTIDLTRLSSFAVSNELIEPGDVLEVTIISGYADNGSLASPVRVGENGTAAVPLVGEVALAGLELEGAEQVIRAAAVSRGIFRNPHVTVVMEKKKIVRVTVVGAVKTPGVFELPGSSSDLLAALVSAGGLSDDADVEVEVRSPARRNYLAQQASGSGAGLPNQPVSFHQQPQIEPARNVRINLVDATQTGQGGVSLRDGDIVMVRQRDEKSVHVMGLVRRPGRYEIPTNQDLRVLDAVAMASGVSSQVANKLYVIRRVPGSSETAVIKLSLGKAKRDGEENLRLAAGDIVSIEQTPTTAIYDALNNFLRFGLSSSIPIF
jgi:polysaccharide export outer membrane protein